MKPSLDDFDYALPPECIAQAPLAERSASRLLVMKDGTLADRGFTDLPDFLAPGDLIVMNDTRVMHARLYGVKATGGQVEVLVERMTGEDEVLAQLRASKPPKPGSWLRLADAFDAEVIGREGEFYHLRFHASEPGTAAELIERYGKLPLPPYIERQAANADEERYQTVYARERGSVAAPTAGLHFDAPLLERLRDRGIGIAHVTLHVGAGTFQPVRVQDLAQHHMHRERYVLPQATADAIAATQQRGGRIVAVGTTTLRTLESAFLSNADGTLEVGAGPSQADAPPVGGSEPGLRARGAPKFGAGPSQADTPPVTASGDFMGGSEPGLRARGALKVGAGETALFITPGYPFRVVDLLITNFHLPKSTLLMLVSAFGGMENIRAAYRHAIDSGYRFFSYGDAMLIHRHDEI
ncbi:MAG: tRNA preQ1(34) S-adenosylmethionine ribosyltransferase-isomerase QueA [Rhodocyclaceae bacterium]|nr:tRNA preQ1(34) S-adenosylmethionine ribosyltransferase-isomerase QueA [Rhodocyclaceae bacterium]